MASLTPRSNQRGYYQHRWTFILIKCDPVTFHLVHTTTLNYNWETRNIRTHSQLQFQTLSCSKSKVQVFFFFLLYSIPRCTERKPGDVAKWCTCRRVPHCVNLLLKRIYLPKRACDKKKTQSLFLVKLSLLHILQNCLHHLSQTNFSKMDRSWIIIIVPLWFCIWNQIILEVSRSVWWMDFSHPPNQEGNKRREKQLRWCFPCFSYIHQVKCTPDIPILIWQILQ